jgi:hypothetical protein
MTTRFQDLWDRVIAAITKLRNQDTSLQQASREIGISPRTVIRLGGSALRKRKNGRYEAKKSDRLLRMLKAPSPAGPQEVAVPDSHQASMLGEYWNEVHRYLTTGDSSGLFEFDGKYIVDANGGRFDLLTNLHELDRLSSAGVFSFESIYGRTE